jgi:hypothetical protein
MKTINIFFLAILWMLFSVLPTTVKAQRSGVEAWSQTCRNCHRSQPASRYTARQWESIATHMKIYARLTDEETKVILEFLKNGARGTTSVVPAPNNDSKGTTVASTGEDNSEALKNYQLTAEEVQALKAFIQNSEKQKAEKKKAEKKNLEKKER